jgi:hypothetical protein
MFARQVAKAPVTPAKCATAKLARLSSTHPLRRSELASGPAWSFGGLPVFSPKRTNDGRIPANVNAVTKPAVEPIAGNGGPNGERRQPGALKTDATPPKLTKKPREPKASDCGGFEWVVRWELDRVTTKGGWVIQKVELLTDIRNCDGTAFPVETGEGRPSRFPLWEAWRINPGLHRFISLVPLKTDTHFPPFQRCGSLSRGGERMAECSDGSVSRSCFGLL